MLQGEDWGSKAVSGGCVGVTPSCKTRRTGYKQAPHGFGSTSCNGVGNVLVKQREGAHGWALLLKGKAPSTEPLIKFCDTKSVYASTC